jgi:putative endonuclease
MYYLYVLQNVRDAADFYTGYSRDLKKRVEQHNGGKNTSTKGKRWREVYYEADISETVARDRERVLKHDGRVKRFLFDRIKSQFAE